MGNCSSTTAAFPIVHPPVTFAPLRPFSHIEVTFRGKVARLATPITPYVGALLAELSMALELSAAETVAGFVVDGAKGGPLCPLELLHRCQLPAVEAIVVQATALQLNLGPLPPASHEDFLVNEDFASLATHLGTEQSHCLSNNLVRVLMKQGYVRLCLPPELACVVETAKQAAQQFWELDPAERTKAKSYMGTKFLGFALDGAREFIQLRRSEHGMQWPRGAEAQAAALVSLFGLLHNLSHQCLRLVAQGLGLNIDYLNQMLDVSSQGTLETTSLPPSRTRGDSFVGSDVFRVYRYLRPPNLPAPGLRQPATGLHCDMGLLTVSPAGTSRGLAVLNPNGSGWVDAEVGAKPNHVFMFLGETLARLAADPASLARTERKVELPPPPSPCPSIIFSANDFPITPHPSILSSSPPSLASSRTVNTLLALHHAGRISDAALDSALLQLGLPPADCEAKEVHENKEGEAHLRASMHFVDERDTGYPRFSFPFFLRCRPEARITEDLSVARFMEETVLSLRPWTQPLRNKSDY